ncbi:MAG TPA: hypothetical protein VHP31_12305 [Caproicibacter sp.]|nr:hypothetical protein [Caproicibacter sp.]
MNVILVLKTFFLLKGVVKTGVTVEELQILVKANITDALAGMTQLRDQLKKTLSAELPNIQSQLAPVKQILDQYGNAFVSDSGKTQDAVKKTGQATQQAAETAKKALQSLEAEHQKINDLVQKQYDAEKKAKELESSQARAALPASAKSVPSALASDILGGTQKQTVADDTPIVNESKLSGWQNFMSRYYTALDTVKAKLNQAGLYGNENSIFGGNSSVWSKVQQGINKVKTSMNSATEATKKYGNQVSETTSKSGSMFGSLGQIIQRFLISAVVYQGVRKLVDAIKSGIQSAIDAPETENLFRVAFGKMSNEAAVFAQKLKDNLGIDEYAAKQMLGTFQELETSMGIGDKTSTKMSESLTMLANDIASLYNVDADQAAENLESALTGQWRAVRKYGYTLSEATIQQTAYKYGLAATGQELTDQQKVIARYLTLIDQSKNAQGDMGRTLGSVQNQLRVLKQNMTAAGRSIGTAFIPFIQAAVPWLNAFAIVIQRVGLALSRATYSMFGMNYDAEMKKQQAVITGINGVGKASTKAANDAADANKKLQNSVLGFDRLNRLDDPNKSKKKKSSGDGSGSDGLDFNVPTLGVPNIANPAEKMADRIMAAFARIRQAVQPTIDAFKLFFASLEPVKQFTATAFEDFFNDYLVPLEKWRYSEEIPGMLNIFSTLNFSINWRAINAGLDGIWKALEKLNEHVGEGLLWFFDNVLRPVSAWALNNIVPTVLDIISTAISVLDDVIQAAKPVFVWLYNNFLEPLGQWTGAVFSNALKVIADALHIIDDLLKGDFPKAASDAKKALSDLWETYGSILGLGGSAVQIKKLGDNVSDSTKRAIEAFQALSTNADKSLKELEWSGETVTKAMADGINKNVQDMADNTIAGFKRQRDESIKNIEDLATLSGGLSKQETNEIVNNINSGYDKKIKAEQENEAKIKTILDKAAKEKRSLTKSESEQINTIHSQMYDTGIKALSKNQVEEQAILENMRVNHTALSAQEAADIVKNSKTTTDKVIADANTKYNDTVAAIIRERDDTHSISSDQADKLIKNAAKERDETVKSAQDKHQKVVAEAKKQSGECVNQVDWQNGQVKSKWDVFTSTFLKSVSDNWNKFKNFFIVEIPKWWNTNVAPWFTAAKWQGLFNQVKMAAQNKWNEIVTWWNNSAIVKWWNYYVAPWFTAKKWESMMDGVKIGFRNVFRDAANFAIDLLNGVMDAINYVIDGMDKIQVNTPSWTPVIGEKHFGINIKPMEKIPHLATGAVLTRSSLVNVAEYPGAQTNPEIVTPQKTMYDTVVAANGELVSAVASLVYQVIDAIRENGGSGDITMDGESLTKGVISHINNITRRTGKCPIVQ